MIASEEGLFNVDIDLENNQLVVTSDVFTKKNHYAVAIENCLECDGVHINIFGEKATVGKRTGNRNVYSDLFEFFPSDFDWDVNSAVVVWEDGKLTISFDEIEVVEDRELEILDG